MNTSFSEVQNYDLLNMHKQISGINNISEFCGCMSRLDENKLTDAYAKLRSSAPRRHKHSKKYFVESHNGCPNGKTNSNRSEEHLAMALWNDFEQLGTVKHTEISNLRLLDYQVPLKARNTDSAVGKADLFAVIDDIYPCVIELKIDTDKTRGDTPLRAFLEAMAYCAIVEANIEDISREAKDKFDLNFQARQPRLMVMAPESYWKKYTQHKKSGTWLPALQKLSDTMTKRIGLQSHFVSLHNVQFSKGCRNLKPKLSGRCYLRSALLRQ